MKVGSCDKERDESGQYYSDNDKACESRGGTEGSNRRRGRGCKGMGWGGRE